MGTRTAMGQRSCCHCHSQAARSLLIFSLLVSSCCTSWATDGTIYEAHNMGINYGRVADNLPGPTEAVALMSGMKIGKVRIYDADPQVLAAFANSGIYLAISVTTDLIGGIATSESTADQFIATNVVGYRNTLVRYIIVGNELFTYPSLNTTWYQVLPAMQNLHTSLLNRGLSDTVKVTTCLAMDILEASYPPSTGQFRSDIETPLMQPILQFISQTNSYFFLNVYPYFAWADNSAQVSIDYALFETGSLEVTVLDGSYKYTNLLDAQVDAVLAAMERVGYGNAFLAIGESGWPTAGGLGANIPYAANYNRRLVTKTLNAVGTPKRLSQFIPTYIFALYNEDLKPGALTEQHWGMLYPNTTEVYPIDMTGKTPENDYPPLAQPAAAPTTSLPSGVAASPAQSVPFVTSGTWCIANYHEAVALTQAALDWSCGSGGADCSAIQPGGVCYNPNTLYDHASYAFNQYFQYEKTKGGSCDFNGAALVTAVNPSPANNTGCVFVYVP